MLVIGASRGLGLEFVRQYREAGDEVLATARDAAGVARLQALGAQAHVLDVSRPGAVETLVPVLAAQPVDVAVYVAGVFPAANAHVAPDQAEFDRAMHTNVWGAMQALVALGPQVRPHDSSASASGHARPGHAEPGHFRPGRFVFISSEMAHIGSVDGSDAWVYRASKAALNMAVAAAQRDWPALCLVALSPGWVQTDMGGSAAPLTPAFSVRSMRDTIARLGDAQRGAFLNHDGQAFDGW
ncbi:short chain dehydrogenase [Comamonas serinivorans]|uniref:Short chain dehydrogenase n=1 Tax=Comamonas serinivorans TaxID=1082851 RepID=A0A1Y0EU53_9BURK|nr:short chain dehydrogenase [Comamonas serinivorans]